jgi:hypothetical protein
MTTNNDKKKKQSSGFVAGGDSGGSGGGGGKMNFFRDGKKIPHTITNIPREGVYFGVCIS